MQVPGRVEDLVARLPHESEVPGSILRMATYFRFPSADSRRAVVGDLRKFVHEVLVGGLNLPGKSMVRSTDRPDMTTNIYRGRKTTTLTT